MPPLTLAEREIFLQTPGVLCRIATVDSEGAPHVTPIWYLYEEDAVFFTPRAQSAWLTHLRADPRVALTIDEEAAPYRKVTARGTARLVHDLGDDDLWRDRYRRIAERYVSPDGAAH